MKIDATTLSILKNFAKINNSIIVNPGQTLKTVSQSKTIVGKANVSTVFETKFAVYDLNRFLSTLSLFTDPILDFSDKYVTISDNNRSVKYTYADESTILKAPEKDLVLPSEDVALRITNEDMKAVEKALGVLGMPEIVIAGDGENISLQAADTKNPTGDVFSVAVGQTSKTFKAIFKAENIKILPGDYQVVVCSKGISHWKSDTVEYYIAVETSSVF